MEADEQQAALRPGERIERRAQQVVGHVLIERPLVVAHLVFVEAAAPLREGTVEKLLRLTPERALQDHAEAPLQLVLLAGDERAVVGRAEDAAERLDVAQQGAGRLDVLHEAPQLDQRVLHRRRREQEDRRGPQEPADPVRHQRLVRGLVVDAVRSVALVESGKDLVRFVDDDKVEWRCRAERLGTRPRCQRTPGQPGTPRAR